MVHPEDERYRHLIGKHVRLPLAERSIPIIADEYVDREFGTGVVKITPAHDFNDYAGRPAPQAGADQHPHAGRQDQRACARPNTRAWTASTRASRSSPNSKRRACSVTAKPHKLMVPRGDRTDVVIEPMLTDQWFVAMSKPGRWQSITEQALECVDSGEIKFVPENWVNTYNQWLNNIQDWCISRQLWWGHQIPAWYDDDGNFYVAHDEAEARKPPSRPARPAN